VALMLWIPHRQRFRGLALGTPPPADSGLPAAKQGDPTTASPPHPAFALVSRSFGSWRNLLLTLSQNVNLIVLNRIWI